MTCFSWDFNTPTSYKRRILSIFVVSRSTSDLSSILCCSLSKYFCFQYLKSWLFESSLLAARSIGLGSLILASYLKVPVLYSAVDYSMSNTTSAVDGFVICGFDRLVPLTSFELVFEVKLLLLLLFS